MKMVIVLTRPGLLIRGNSLALRIPKSFATEVGLRTETSVDVSLSSGKLIVTPIAETKMSLKQLLANVTKDNLHHKIDTGPAMGNETW